MRIITLLAFMALLPYVLAAQTIDGIFNESKYISLGTQQNSGTPCLSAQLTISEILYYTDATNLYIGLVCQLPISTNYEIALLLDFNELSSGKPAGGNLALAGCCGYMNSTNNSNMGFIGSSFETDYMFGINMGNTTTSFLVDAARITTSGITAGSLGDCGSGAIHGKTLSGVFGGSGVDFAFNNSRVTTGTSKTGFEIKIPFSAVTGGSISSTGKVTMFAFTTDYMGYVSNRPIPGTLASAYKNGCAIGYMDASKNFSTTSPTSKVLGSGFATAQQPLPIELLSLTAKAFGSFVDLHWQTASEKNNDRFEIERSGDGAAWTTLGAIKGSGNSIIEQDYEFRDEDPGKGTNYYKLKQIDWDGNYSFSSIISVVGLGKKGELIVSPNPVEDKIKISVGSKVQTGTIEIYNAAGKLVKQFIVAGDTYDVADLASGMYAIRIIDSAGAVHGVNRFVK